MKINYPFILLIFAMVFCFGCKKKCTENKLGDLTQYNPLNGTETVVFVDSSGNEYSFIGEGRRILIYSYDDSFGECYEVEGDNCYHQESDNKYRLRVGLRPFTFHDPAFMFIELADYRYNDRWHYDSRTDFNIPLDKNNLDENQFYFDSIIVNNRYQFDVFAGVPDLDRTPTTKETLLDTVHPSMFYYNKQNGLVKVDFDDGTTWELKEIIP
jgi:hypothetical protein